MNAAKEWRNQTFALINALPDEPALTTGDDAGLLRRILCPDEASVAHWKQNLTKMRQNSKSKYVQWLDDCFGLRDAIPAVWDRIQPLVECGPRLVVADRAVVVAAVLAARHDQQGFEEFTEFVRNNKNWRF